MKRSIKNILKRIEKEGIKAYLVGGYVRDTIIKKKTYDIDIAINTSSKKLLKTFKNSYYNETYDALKIKIGKYKIDITPFRNEFYDHNIFHITYNTTLEKDANRRDFTINALYIDSEGNLIDPLNALKDIKNKEIKVIGQVSLRLQEDPLRIIRALRFSFQLNFTLERELLNFINNNKQLIYKVSYFHKKEELNKIFSLPNKVECLTFLKENNFLKYFEIDFTTLNYTTNYLGMWAQLTYSPNYSFSEYEKKTITKLKKYKEINNLTLYYLGPDLSYTLNEILNTKINIKKEYKKLPLKNIKELKINYQILHKLGYNDHEISDIINYIEEQVLQNNVLNKRKEIIKFLKNNRR